MSNSWEDRFDKKPARTSFSVGVRTILVVLGLIVVATIGWFVINPLVQSGRVVSQTIDADNVIANYEWFHQQHEDVLAKDVQIENAAAALERFEQSAGPRNTWNLTTSQESARLNAILTGHQQQRATMVADYNARANMANRAIFLDNDLPERLQ